MKTSKQLQYVYVFINNFVEQQKNCLNGKKTFKFVSLFFIILISYNLYSIIFKLVKKCELPTNVFFSANNINTTPAISLFASRNIMNNVDEIFFLEAPG